MPESEYLTYKGKPLVRKGNDIYYGDVSKKFLILFHVNASEKVGKVPVSGKITVSLIDNDAGAKDPNRVVKQCERDGFYAAMDIGEVWLDRALKE